MSKFWTIASILDFFFCLALMFIIFPGLSLAQWQFALIFLVGDLAITLVAALVDGVDDWFVYVLYCFGNYFVMFTIMIAIADVYIVIYIMTIGAILMSVLLKFAVFNLIVIVIWLLTMRTKKAVDSQLTEKADETDRLD